MPQVILPAKVDEGRKRSGFSSFLEAAAPIAGAAAGLALAPATGGASLLAGAGTGAALGGTVGGLLGRATNTEKAASVTGGQALGSDESTQSAVQRRLASIGEDPMVNIRQAQAALTTMPKNIQAEYGPVLNDAYAALYKQKQIGVT